MRRPSVGRVHAEHAQRAAGDRRDAGDHAHGGGLAGAVGAEDAERLAPVQVEVDAVDRGEGRAVALLRGEPFYEVLRVDQDVGVTFGPYADRTTICK